MIYIKHLPKNELVLELYRGALLANNKIFLANALSLKDVDAYLQSVKERPFDLDYIAIPIADLGNAKFQIALKINISEDFIPTTEKYNALFGENKAEEIIHTIRQKTIKKIRENKPEKENEAKAVEIELKHLISASEAYIKLEGLLKKNLKPVLNEENVADTTTRYGA